MENLSMNSVLQAKETLKAVTNHTPMLKYQLLEKEFYVKAEFLQRCNSFKMRGAYYSMSNIDKAILKNGVVTASAGNHASAVALSASLFGVSSKIVMPVGASELKKTLTQTYGGEVVLKGANFMEAMECAREIVKEEGREYVHPYENYDAIAGHGTIGMEILEALPDVDQVLVPVGGGGLCAGIAYVCKQLKPSVKVIGVEVEGADPLKKSFEIGKRIKIPYKKSIADGIAAMEIGEIPYGILEKYCDEVVTVTDDEIKQCIKLMLLHGKVLLEGSGAAPIAAILSEKVSLDGKSVAVASGGNIDDKILIHDVLL